MVWFPQVFSSSSPESAVDNLVEILLDVYASKNLADEIDPVVKEHLQVQSIRGGGGGASEEEDVDGGGGDNSVRKLLTFLIALKLLFNSHMTALESVLLKGGKLYRIYIIVH